MTTASLVLTPPDNERQWTFVKNDGGDDVPAFGIVIVTGSESLHDREVLTVSLPTNNDNALTKAIGVCYQPVRAGSYGWATFQWPAYVAYNAAMTPTFGELVGPFTDGQLQNNSEGFMVIGSPQTSPRRVLVHRDIGFHRPLFIRVELTDTLATTDASTTDFAVLTKYAGLPEGIETISLIHNPPASSDYIVRGRCRRRHALLLRLDRRRLRHLPEGMLSQGKSKR